MNGSTQPSKATTGAKELSRSLHDWFSLPDPVRQLFNKFPLLSLASNDLPQRSRQRNDKHVLYIFSTSHESSRTNWSCNPTCLKWQSYLIIKKIPFVTQPSNNHASPSGSLPFLLPAHSTNTARPQAIASSKLAKWATGSDLDGGKDTKEEVYTALIDQNVRNAWLYCLYLDRDNFDKVAHQLYVSSSSSNVFVQAAIAVQLQSAAREELLKSRTVIDDHEIYEAADRAFHSLSTLLGERKYFTDANTPDYFDATVFAYTHLILDELLGWKTLTLQNLLRQYPNLCQHRNNLLAFCLEV